MKAILPIIALMVAPAMISQAHGAETAGLPLNLLPSNGTMKAGVAVNPQFSPEFLEMQKSLLSRLQKLSSEEQLAFMEKYDPLTLIAYDAKLWPDKEEYDRYKTEWKKATIQPIREVAVGLKQTNANIWSVISLTTDAQTRRSAPLTISALSYNSAKNEWISNNGVLTVKEYTATEDNVYGAQTGYEWTLEKEDSLSKMSESIRISRNTDGKAFYIFYSFSERSTISNTVIAQGGYTLMFPLRITQVNMGAPGSR